MRRLFSSVTLAALLVCSPAAARADVVLEWNAIAVSTMVSQGQNPFAQARLLAITQLAVFEAVNAITGDYKPYLGTVVAPAGASVDAAAVAAAYGCSRTIPPWRRISILRMRRPWRLSPTALPRAAASRRARPRLR